MKYDVIRSDRRTLALEITRTGAILVRAPKGLPQAGIEAFVQAHEAWIRENLQKQQVRLAAHPEPEPEEIARLREQAKTLLPPKVAAFSAQMGLHPAGITITGARTRFGSCSSKGRLCFSWRLMTYPDEAIDYVVVHELAHLVHFNHSRAFYALIESVLPDYRQRMALLKE